MNRTFIWYKNIGRDLFRFVTIHAFDRRTDERTDRKMLIGRPRLHSCSAVKSVLTAAVPVVSGTLTSSTSLSRSNLLHIELHSLDVPEPVTYKLSVMIFDCLHDLAPQYMLDLSL